MAVTFDIVVRKKGRKVGTITWAADDDDWVGHLESVEAQPKKLKAELENRLTDNVDAVARSGGVFPENPSEYWECVIRVLEEMKKDYDWFDYNVPALPPKREQEPGVIM
jgi:hypothetical protein